MIRTSRRRPRRALAIGVVLTSISAAGLAAWLAFPGRGSRSKFEAIRRVAVQRADLQASVRAGGRIESAKKTLIECQLENLRYSAGGGNSISTSGRSTILEIVPDGSSVRRDDVLCRIDSSDYEELVRQQEIKLQQSRNEFTKAELDLQAAEMGLVEFRDGVLPDEFGTLEGSIVTARSDIQRQSDRMKWAKRMLKNGYLSEGQYVGEKQKMLRADITLSKLLGQKALLSRFQGPISIKNLEMQVESARSILAYQELRLRRTEQLLDKFRSQVELCTVRAPHDGFVIYANESDGDPRVELGAQVYQKMDLFYLPDLAQMEVQATLHETIVDRVREGMPVRVRVESMPLYELEGHVVSIAPLPIVPRGLDNGVKNYLGKIRLDSSPKGLLPGMSAEVEIQGGRSLGALVIPTRSLVADGDRDYCYVAGQDGLELREVTLGQATHDLLEVRTGLEEGEEVVEDPSTLGENPLKLAATTAVAPPAPGPRDEPEAPVAE